MSQRDRSDPFKSSPASSNHLTAEDKLSYASQNGDGVGAGRRSARRRRDVDDVPIDSEGAGIGGTPRRRRMGTRTSSRPSRRTLDYREDETEDHESAHLPELDDIDDGESTRPPRARHRAARNPSIGATAFAKRRWRNRGHAPSLRIPANIAQSALIADQVSLVLIGTTLFSLLLMWITVANRFGSLPNVMELRYGPEGVPSLVTGPRALFRLPLLATIVTIMNVLVAWFISAGDRFAGRLIVAAAGLVHLLIWIAIAALVW
jgi:hypothetical protein